MKGIMQTQGMGNIRSMHSTGARSIPKVQRSSYLELYALRRERDRLEKEIYALNKRTNLAHRQLDGVIKRIGNLRKDTNEEQEGNASKSVPPRRIKTMTVNY